MTDAITKTCTKCGVAKGLECFGKHRLGKSGLQPACRACRAIEKRKYVEKNREKVHASRKAYKSANKDKINAQRREAYAGEGGKRQREYKRAWRRANPEKFRAGKARYAKRHPDRVSARKRRQYLRLRVLKRPILTPEQRREEKRARAKAWASRQSESLGESYIRKLLAAATWAPRSAIPLVLIDTHRVHLKIKRLLRQRKPA